MRIALAGVGDVGSYFIEEFHKSDHEVVVLTRKEKDLAKSLGICQRITTYTADDLFYNIRDCDAVVSTIGGLSDDYVRAHDALLQACIRSDKCKRFIPSEWTINIEDFPDQPLYSGKARHDWRDKLKEQKEIKYTFVCNGWFAEYIFPLNRRYLGDVGAGFPVEHGTKRFHVYGDGRQRVTLTSARDVARAALAILSYEGDWPQYTHIAGETLTYLELYDIMKQHDNAWTKQTILFSTLFDRIAAAKRHGMSYSEPALALLGFMRCNEVSEEKRLVWGEGILEGVQARGIKRLLKQADERPDENP
ncbi:hypothetical protein FPCIR_14334 [Fusarium pseudocircinatum]|uniref:NmrA-like domain-containing protein n=1 Tax=Fusarium pseudocircinatum TaxID=56676 RepID=A0A8H5KDE9_9HYPO|nr:hypothetical protein FPCIR_14334 [Fusarium pseudocircinatum]